MKLARQPISGALVDIVSPKMFAILTLGIETMLQQLPSIKAYNSFILSAKEGSFLTEAIYVFPSLLSLIASASGVPAPLDR